MPSTSPASVAQAINSTISQTTGHTLLPSPRELLSLPLRALHHAETFAFSTVPRHIARMAGIEDISLNLWPTAAPVAGQDIAHEAMNAAAEIAAGAPEVVEQVENWYLAELTSTMRKVGGFFGYLTSIWSFACLVEVSATFLYIFTWLPLRTATGLDPESYHDIRIHAAPSATGMAETPCPAHYSHRPFPLTDFDIDTRNSVPNVSRLCGNAIWQARQTVDI